MMFDDFGINAGYVEDLHSRFLHSPGSVEPAWRSFFERLAPSPSAVPAFSAAPAPVASPHAAPEPHANAAVDRSESLLAAAAMQGRVYQLLNAYRVRGHLFADVDPLGVPPEAASELDLANFGLTIADLDKPFGTAGMWGLPKRAPLRHIIEHLGATYCSSIGVEFTLIEYPERRHWLEERMETSRNLPTLDRSELLRILTKLTDAEIFEQFIHKNYVGAKRFSLEGAESMIPMLDLLVETAGQQGIEGIVIGMAHRGRLNVLANIMGKDVREIFAAFNDKAPQRFLGGGDVKYHLGYSNDVTTSSGAKVHISLAFNPSHLEWVNPVVQGRVRAKQDRTRRKTTLALLIHGDAAFMGQGVVAETLNLCSLKGYSTAGTIHLVVNNQIGFTTVPRDSRSTRYCTDLARMLRIPVFHVNGDDPEAVIQVTRLATEYRQRFQQDVVIDMYCYRKYGHNEGDEPRFTQPIMYSVIDHKPGVRELYVQRLIRGGHVTRDEANAIVSTRRAQLEAALDEAKKGDFHRMPEAMGGVWAGYRGGSDKAVPDVPTGVPREKLVEALERTTVIPDDFHAHPKVRRTIEQRRERALSGEPFDWGTAEQLAFATLLLEGHDVRLTGQDVRRGTFSHRHAILYDTDTGVKYCPLAQVGPGRVEIYDSPLSEAGVLGFEYGYSLERPDKLIVWEAQFGDFLNCAQVIIDQFLVSAEDKWIRLSGMVLLLPHGYEGQGPEHSSARIERLLQLSSEDNIQVCYPTTPAQLFHLLRRQILRPIRKPLFIFSPKSMLRPNLSTLEELTTGIFQRVIPDTLVDPLQVTRILLCSGKVYYDLAEGRKQRGRNDIAIVRLEQLYPVSDALAKALAPYKAGTPLVWVQEEPHNMGAWYFLNARIQEFLGDRHPLSVVSRLESASPATGSAAAHQLEQRMVVDGAFAPR
ncbi:MAG: 2-oxoglutarate dehydrogenase E1 component [Myxococcales bacterium]